MGMSKWAIWTAHRYLERDSGPRRTGRDGRPLARPWRDPAPEVRAAAASARAARAQPRWPRLVGFALVGVACMFALEPVRPVVADRRASGASGTVPAGAGFAADAPVGAVAAAALTEFRWRAGDVAPPFTFVLLDGAYAELARRDGIGAARLPVDAGLAALLTPGQLRHWHVLGDRAGKPVASPLARVEIR
jgi:hypothetical protein